MTLVDAEVFGYGRVEMLAMHPKFLSVGDRRRLWIMNAADVVLGICRPLSLVTSALLFGLVWLAICYNGKPTSYVVSTFDSNGNRDGKMLPW